MFAKVSPPAPCNCSQRPDTDVRYFRRPPPQPRFCCPPPLAQLPWLCLLLLQTAMCCTLPSTPGLTTASSAATTSRGECGTACVSLPPTPALALAHPFPALSIRRGHQVYKEVCSSCHRYVVALPAPRRSVPRHPEVTGTGGSRGAHQALLPWPCTCRGGDDARGPVPGTLSLPTPFPRAPAQHEVHALPQLGGCVLHRGRGQGAGL